jgi:hypothetical protein
MVAALKAMAETEFYTIGKLDVRSHALDTNHPEKLFMKKFC